MSRETVTVVLRLPKDLVEKMDEVLSAECREVPPLRLTRQQWVQSTPEGRAIMLEITRSPQYKNWDIKEINAMLKARYIKAVGQSKPGRKPVANLREAFVIKCLVNAMQEYCDSGDLSVLKTMRA